MTEAFVSTELVERHGVELAFVQVGHRTLALLLTQRAGGIQCVLEAVSKKTWSYTVRHVKDTLIHICSCYCNNVNSGQLTLPPGEIRSHQSPERKACGTSVEMAQYMHRKKGEIIQTC